MANGDVDSISHDLVSLLSSEKRDYVVRNNGDQYHYDSFVTLNQILIFGEDKAEEEAAT
ncbi:hypothetical protein SO802_011794 [Lithocarpus litseifolius]|uniref:Uncharacterized protein n=1 Tax=Lithocarpus litseifolius TaxID=425828 RepID=A0AAW2D104_9ROSI